MKLDKPIIALVALIALSFQTAIAQDILPEDNGLTDYHGPPNYRPSESHPLRIVGYILHPIGWVIREGIFRPISYFASSTETRRAVMGFRDPYDYKSPVCFRDSDRFPDCRNVPPYNSLDPGPSGASKSQMAIGERQIFFPEIAFDFDKATLNPLGKGRVRQVAQLLASSPSLRVVVEGHTDKKGTDQYNINLGQKRASAVIAELTDLGVDPARMSPLSLGESKPVFTDGSRWSDAVNRRVEFSIGS